MVLNLKNVKKNVFQFLFKNMRSAGYHEKMIGRTYVGVDQVTQLNLVLYNTRPAKSPGISGSLQKWGVISRSPGIVKKTPGIEGI